jgi:MOSC domain-containing protein YiiM
LAPRILQINISPGGVPKTPIARAEVGPLGIVGDGHRFRLHGGREKALLILASEVIDTLRAEGWPLFFGALGENLTTEGLDYRNWRTGQRFKIGQVLLELTTPREPCRTLNPYGRGMPRRLREKPGEAGFYAAVLVGGILTPEAIIESVEPVS